MSSPAEGGISSNPAFHPVIGRASVRILTFYILLLNSIQRTFILNVPCGERGITLPIFIGIMSSPADGGISSNPAFLPAIGRASVRILTFYILLQYSIQRTSILKIPCGERGITLPIFIGIMSSPADGGISSNPAFLPAIGRASVRILTFYILLQYSIQRTSILKIPCGERGITLPIFIGIMSSPADGGISSNPAFLPAIGRASVRILTFYILLQYSIQRTSILKIPCGERGIRTLDTAPHGIHTFQACAFNHSATSPEFQSLRVFQGENY